MKIILSLLFMICTAYSSLAQNIELTAYSGFIFADKIPITGGDARLENSPMIGGIFSYGIDDFYSVEFQYSFQPTTVRASSTFFENDFDSDANISYYLIGASRILPTNNPGVKVYSSLKLGLVTLNPKRDNNYETVTRFAGNIGLGVKYDITDKVGFRFGPQLNFPIVNSGAGLWWSSSGGVDVGVSSWSSITQFNLLGGLYLKFNKSEK